MRYIGMATVITDTLCFFDKGQEVHCWEYEEGEEREDGLTDPNEGAADYYVALSNRAVRMNYGLDAYSYELQIK